MAALAPVQVAREGDKKCGDTRSSKNQHKLVAPAAVRNYNKLRCCRGNKNAPRSSSKKGVAIVFKNVSSKQTLRTLMATLCILSVSVNARGFGHQDENTKDKMQYFKENGGFKKVFHFLRKSFNFYAVLAVFVLVIGAVFLPLEDALGEMVMLLDDSGASLYMRIAILIPGLVLLGGACFTGFKRYQLLETANTAEDYNHRVKYSKHATLTIRFAAIAMLFTVALIGALAAVQGENFGKWQIIVSFVLLTLCGGAGLYKSHESFNSVKQYRTEYDAQIKPLMEIYKKKYATDANQLGEEARRLGSKKYAHDLELLNTNEDEGDDKIMEEDGDSETSRSASTSRISFTRGDPAERSESEDYRGPASHRDDGNDVRRRLQAMFKDLCQ